MRRKMGFLLSLLLLSSLLSACEPLEKWRDLVVADSAYLDAAAYQSGFLAVGTGGRMDQIGPDGTVKTLETGLDQPLLAVAVRDGTAVAVGAGGTGVMLAEGKAPSALTPATRKTLCSGAFFGEGFYAGGEDGLLYTRDFQVWQQVPVAVKGMVTGLAANSERVMGVTDQGETFTSADGLSWSVLDYNEYYSQTVTFVGIEACDNIFYAFGTDEAGGSRLLSTQAGGVWSERGLWVGDEPVTAALTALCWDGQQTVAALADGQILTLPDCAQCNKIQKVSDKMLSAAACNGGKLLFAGVDFTFELLETENVRQYKIKSPAALEMQRNGALIIDVRGQADYDQKHIAGSVHLDVDKVSQGLPALCPDKERTLIFYCKSGVRSQTALETARAMGYINLYNLGGIDDWAYEVEGAGA